MSTQHQPLPRAPSEFTQLLELDESAIGRAHEHLHHRLWIRW